MIPLTISLFENTNMKDWYKGDTTTLLITLLTISTIIWYLYIFFFKSKSQNLPPGPPGLPIFGNLLSLDPELHTYFAGLAQTHGPIFKLRLGSKLGIVITSPSTAREVLKDYDTVFANRDPPAAGKAATYGGSDISWSPYGPQWRMLRKVCVVKMLSNKSLDSVYELRRGEVRKMVEYIHNCAGSTVSVGEQVFLTVLNVITNMMWGAAMEDGERESLGAEFRKTAAEMVQLIGKPNLSDFFPALARFDLQGIVKDMNLLVPRFDGIFEKMIGERMVKDVEGKESESKDFLQFLLNLKEEGDSKTPFTSTHVKALLLVCYLCYTFMFSVFSLFFAAYGLFNSDSN